MPVNMPISHSVNKTAWQNEFLNADGAQNAEPRHLM